MKSTILRKNLPALFMVLVMLFTMLPTAALATLAPETEGAAALGSTNDETYERSAVETKAPEVGEYHLMNRGTFKSYYHNEIKENHPRTWGIVMNGMAIFAEDGRHTARQADMQIDGIYNVYAGESKIQPDEISFVRLYGTYAWGDDHVDIPIDKFDVISYPKQGNTQAYAELYFKGEAPEPPAPTAYNVTFDLNYQLPGELPQSYARPVNEGEVIDAPIVQRDGYTLLGWYESEPGVYFDFTTPITKSFTLYADWQKDAPVYKYTMDITYNYDNNSGKTPVSTEVLTATLKDLVVEGVSYTVNSDGVISLGIAESALDNGKFDYGTFVFDKLSDEAVLHPAGQANNTTVTFGKNDEAKKTVQLTYRDPKDIPTPLDAWFFVRTDGLVPVETGNTNYPSNQYLPGHDSKTPLTGTITAESAWTKYYGPIEDNTINGVKLSEAFATVQEAIGTEPSQDAIAAALASVGYNSETHGIMWYVVKKMGDGSPCPGYHVDGVLYNKGTNPEQVRVLNYHSNTPNGQDELLAYAIFGLGATATVGDLTPTYAEYEFIGWNSKADGTGSAYSAGNTIIMNNDVNLYAQWREIGTPPPTTYNVTYDWGTENVPSAANLPAGATVDAGSEYTVDTTYPKGHEIKANDGTYTFNGWGQTGTITINQSLTINGSWSFEKDPLPATYTVRYDWTNAPEGIVRPIGTTVGADGNYSYTVDTSFAEGDTVEADEGTYTFNGWDQTGTITIEENLIINGSWSFVAAPIDPIATKVGIWHYYVGDPEIYLDDPTAENALGEDGIILREYDQITKTYIDGLASLAHYENPNGLDMAYNGYEVFAYYDDGRDSVKLELGQEGYVDLTGIHTLRIHLNYYQVRYFVTYNANGSVGEDINLRYNTAKTHTVLANDGVEGNPSFTREGFTFTGWTTDPQGEELVLPGATGEALAKGERITYYAQWNEIVTPDPGPGPNPGPGPRPDPRPDPDPTPGPGPEPIPEPEEEIEIGEPEIPLGPAPEIEETFEEEIITDEEVPLGDLPQTGAVAVDPSATLGLLALATSLALAGLGFVLSRKKEEEA